MALGVRFNQIVARIPLLVFELEMIPGYGLPTVSVTRWLYHFSIFRHLEQREIAQKYKIFAKVGSQFFQILNSYSRNGQTLFKILPKWRIFAKSCHTAYGPEKEDCGKLSILSER